MSFDLTKILPHKPPMLLLDDILEVDIENCTLSSLFRVYPEKLFYTKDGINTLAGIEFMAQTIGCYAYFKNQCCEPKPGLLLGTRLYNNKVEYFKEGEEYKVVSDCLIYDTCGEEIASATINAYQSDNVMELLNGK